VDIKELEYFVRVGQLGSFSKAATMLSVAQPSLSKRVRQLEVELRENLFRRNGRMGLSFTEEGALFFTHAQKIIDQIDLARRELADLKRSPTGKLVIGAVPDARKLLAPRLVGEFRTRYPRATLEVLEEKSGTVYEWLMQGRIDMGIMYDPVASPRVHLVPLLAQELCLVSCAAQRVVPKARQVEFRDLERLPLILPNHEHSLRRRLEAEAVSTGIKLNVPLEIMGASFILELVRQGHGCTVLAKSVTHKENFSKKFQINDIVNPRLQKNLTLVTPARASTTRLTKEAAELVADIIRSAG
jgi:LysR family nitrogen assimilation transcriptional regulator